MKSHQIKQFCKAKETINRIKRQSTKQKKMFGNHTCDKWLIFKIYKEVNSVRKPVTGF